MPPDILRPDRETAGLIAARLEEEHYGTGPLAELRRLDPGGGLITPALHRLLVRYVETDHREKLRLWALFIHSMALVSPQMGERLPLGRALFEAGYSEGRLSRLLAARAEEMVDVLPRMMRFLKTKGIAVQPTSLWDLLHATMTPAFDTRWADEARTRVARGYYQAEDTALRPQAVKGSAA